MRHIIDAIAAEGRNGDDELLHVSKRELAALDRLANAAGTHLTRNPRTGIREAFNIWPTLGGIAGGIAGTFVAPGAGTAAGAALGSGAATAASGGTTEQALTTGLISGVTAYAGGAALGSLSEAGAGAATGAVTDAATNTATGAVTDATATGAVTDATASGLTTGTADVASGGVQAGVTNAGTNTLNVPQTALSNSTSIDTGGVMGNGVNNAGIASTGTPSSAANTSVEPSGLAGNTVNNGGAMSNTTVPTDVPPAAKPDFSFSNVAKGVEATPTKDLVTKYGADFAKTAMGAGMVGMTPVGEPAPIDIPGKDTKMKYKAEYYQGPEGEIRTRAVPMAQGGLASMFSNYDAADAEADGGYRPGGAVGYAGGGGIGFVRSIQPGGQWGDMTSDLYGVVQEHKPEWLQKIEPGGFLGATVPGKMDWEDKQRQKQADEEARKQQEAEAAKKLAAQNSLKQELDATMTRNMAAGGIASFGKGRYLQGAGDGMSDSIPADIDGKRPARLATGEFVVPADVVSGLGNGDSTAGAKQLHAMMDRTRQARTGTKKQGKQINPRKMMPV